MSASAAAFFESSRRGRGRPAGLILKRWCWPASSPWCWPAARPRARRVRGPWPGQSVASTARCRQRPSASPVVGGRRLARERRCQRPSNGALAISAPPWRVEALAVLAGILAVVLAGGSPTHAVLDVLQIPQRNRRTGAYKRLAALMATLGWTAVRVKGMTRRGYARGAIIGASDCDREHLFPIPNRPSRRAFTMPHAADAGPAARAPPLVRLPRRCRQGTAGD